MSSPIDSDQLSIKLARLSDPSWKELEYREALFGDRIISFAKIFIYGIIGLFSILILNGDLAWDQRLITNGFLGYSALMVFDAVFGMFRHSTEPTSIADLFMPMQSAAQGFALLLALVAVSSMLIGLWGFQF